MKIIFNNRTVLLSDIEVGGLFKFNDSACVYIITDETEGSDIICVRLDDGIVVKYNEDTEVVRFYGELNEVYA